MKRYGKKVPEGTRIYVGIYLHKKNWHITIRTEDVELFSGSIPGEWRFLYTKIEPYLGNAVYAVYEAGCFGYWLYDKLVRCGVRAIVTPPSLVPGEYGNYETLSDLVSRQTKLVRELAATDTYRERVKLLESIPGIGVLTAMEILVELQDIGRFARPEQLAAYVGLTPSQYSSGDNIRMGRITKIGKNHLRGTLIEAAWTLKRSDRELASVYERIKMRAGGKRAIVAVACRLLLRTRKMLLQHRTYQELYNAA